MNIEQQLFLTENEARSLYMNNDSAHDFDHVARVAHMAVYLAHAEGADEVVVRLAALLHDAPTTSQIELMDAIAPMSRERSTISQDTNQSISSATRRDHHFAAADFAHRLLAGRGMEPERVANVVHCIEAHRFRDQSIQPQTLEACCLYDADKLDSMGAIGVGRAFAYAGRHNSRLWTTPHREIPPATEKPRGVDYTPVHEFVYKLRQLSDSLYTDTARRIGEQRHAFLCAFFDQLDAEMLGVI